LLHPDPARSAPISRSGQGDSQHDREQRSNHLDHHLWGRREQYQNSLYRHNDDDDDDTENGVQSDADERKDEEHGETESKDDLFHEDEANEDRDQEEDGNEEHDPPDIALKLAEQLIQFYGCSMDNHARDDYVHEEMVRVHTSLETYNKKLLDLPDVLSQAKKIVYEEFNSTHAAG
jgi:hypothetical protein